ncbi:sodium/potassium-transporting ATPase subunit beta-2 [Microcaecilia unicolor]|uniref:Sodium/potassium-transporting ATPase subunit beta n=1 Tax=Microcaecilia unicolor TaxID=1415580 RepID=A0A6P7X0B8_9AMPH|nr:sodium/potassium-transporting ATPase subunit beta-2-like [Microcaecilia unicolor]
MAALSQKKSCQQRMDEWKEFIWNPRTHEFMGRTGSSWALILLFYVVFYGFLTALFSLTMWVMLQTIDDYVPTYQDRLANPGLMIRPKSDSLDIVFSSSDNATWKTYVNKLDDFLPAYDDMNQTSKNENCPSGTYFEEKDKGNVQNHPKRACQFKRSFLGRCSGLEDATYGYSEGKPCVLIKMNRVINFKPRPVPATNPFITIDCTGKKDEDIQHLGDLQYFPNNGSNFGTIDLMYFPYYGYKVQANYTQPLVAVQFLNVTQNVDIYVECKVLAQNIKNDDDRDKFAGRVAFKLKVNS